MSPYNYETPQLPYDNNNHINNRLRYNMKQIVYTITFCITTFDTTTLSIYYILKIHVCIYYKDVLI